MSNNTQNDVATSTTLSTGLVVEKDGYKETKLGWIPEDWEVVELGSIGKVISGLTYSPNDVVEDGTLVLRSSNIQKGNLKFEDNVYVDTSSLKFREVQENDILICVRNGSKNLIGKNTSITKSLEGVAFGAFMTIYRSALNTFLKHYFKTEFYQREIHKNLGATINSINGSNLKKFRVPLPPLSEQQKIASILNTWDNAIAAQEKLIAQKQALKKGLMQQLLTGKKRFPGFEEEWEEFRLEDVCDVNGKYGIGAAAVEFSNDLPRYLRITDIDDDGNYSPEKEVSVSEKTWNEYVLEDGDIVFARTGNTTGKTYLYQEKDGVLVYAGFLIKFRPKSDKLNPNYLKFFTQTEPYWSWVKTMSVRSGQPGINSKEYGKLKLELPSIEEQAKIVSLLKTKENEISKYQSYVKELKKQKQGLMQQLLTGEKRVEI